MRTVAELKRLLRQKVEKSELGDLLVETVIARLKEQRYLNDTSYATTYSSLRKENDRFGRAFGAGEDPGKAIRDTPDDGEADPQLYVALDDSSNGSTQCRKIRSLAR